MYHFTLSCILRRFLFSVCKLFLAGIILQSTCIYTAKAQITNWDDSLTFINRMDLSENVKADKLGDKAYYLTTIRDLATADKFLNEQFKHAQVSGNKSSIGYAYYCLAVRNYTNIKSDSSLKLIQLATTNSEEGEVILYKARSARLMAQYYESVSDIDQALKAVEKAEQYTVQLNDTFERAKTAVSYGFILARTKDLKAAIRKYTEAIGLLENGTDYRTLAIAYNALGNLLLKEKDFEKAKSYFEQNIDLCNQAVKWYRPTAFLAMATYYYTLEQVDSALKFYDLADESMQAAADYTRLYLVYTNKATIYSKKGVADSAKYYFQGSIDIAEQMKMIGNLGRLYLNYSSYLNELNETDSALAVVDKALTISNYEKDGDGYSEALKLKAEILMHRSDFNGASDYYNKVITYKDSLFLADKKAEINRLAEEYESTKKQNEIARLKTERQIQQLELEKKNAVIHGNLEEARQRQSEIDLLNKEKTIRDLQLKQREDELSRKKAEAAAGEKALSLSRQNGLLKEQELNRQRQMNNAFLVAALIVLLLVGLIFNQYRIGQKRINEIEVHRLQHQLSELKLEALQAQMNPHFIFNALNSINRYIIRSDRQTASEYLIKFSKLMRLVLENSRVSTVTLEDELEALKLYIELEALRFENKFEAEIHVDPSIDVIKTRIPPMLLQPIVENSIWHGLQNKTEKGHLSIAILKNEIGALQIVIEDNGIGRDKSAMLKSLAEQQHKSFGTKITHERMELYNGNNFGLKITDLNNEQHQPAGTRVEFRITPVTT